MRIFQELKIDFLGKRKTAYIISSTLLLLGIISLVVRGLLFGIDFKGGTEIALQFETEISITQVRDDLNNIGLGNVEVKTFGDERGILVRTELQEIPSDVFPRVIEAVEMNIKKIKSDAQFTLIDSTSNSITYGFSSQDVAGMMVDKLFDAGFQTSSISDNQNENSVVVRVGVADWIEEILREKMPENPFIVQKSDNVGPKIGNELKTDALIAIALSLVVILVYIGFRFKFAFAVGAVAALFHDVIITLGVFSLLYGIVPFLNLEITINVVAAFLTLVGYSINDTVVVFDRIREDLKIHKTGELKEIMNGGINKVIPRTIITSLTTFIVVLILFIFGGEVLRGFAFTLTFGIIIGTYSSIFVASSFVYEYTTRGNRTIKF
ncbi:MAG: hypothetical protein SCALA702_33420 [Melioribacteraceae bacterium]|nr:MAG: hypothetical protein SCALA702_33420 [Melioribacteraceae bacterium]